METNLVEMSFLRDLTYNVMQSDGNRFCGDVVLDSFNMAYGHEDSVLDKNYEKQISRDRYYKDFEFWK